MNKMRYMNVIMVTAVLLTAILTTVSCKTPSAHKGVSPKTIEVPSTWRVVSLQKNGYVTHITAKEGVKNPEITFKPEGALSGNTGVNAFSGTYVLKSNAVTFDVVGITYQLGLNAGANDNERAFLAAINKTALFELSAKRLTLYDAKKKILLLCELAALSASATAN